MKNIVFVLTLITLVFGFSDFSSAQNYWTEREKARSLPVQETNRPLRKLYYYSLTIGQTEGDLIGSDDKVIQAGIEYLNRMGGGTLHILPGVYELRNAIYLRPNITIRGSGEKTVLKLADGFSTPIIRNADAGEYGFQVEDPSGFRPGRGIMLRTTARQPWAVDTYTATVTRIDGDIIYIDKMADKDFHLKKQCWAATSFPVITGQNIDNVKVEDIVLDGNKEKNDHINGNFSGAVFLKHCNNWSFKNVTARNYNGDGFSWQTCDDISFDNCKSLNNTDLGFHPGTGAQRPVIINSTASGNSQGIYFCWGVSDGFVENCILSENNLYGISIGHRDTENIILNSLIENNKEVGILFRKDDDDEFFAGNRNLIKNCVVKDNGKNSEGIGIDIRWKTKDIAIENTKFVNSRNGGQKIGIRIGKDTEGIKMSGNSFENIDIKVENLQK